MRGMFNMCLMRCLIESASREDGRKRKKADGRKLVCSVCRTYGGTMYRRGNRMKIPESVRIAGVGYTVRKEAGLKI